MWVHRGTAAHGTHTAEAHAGEHAVFLERGRSAHAKSRQPGRSWPLVDLVVDCAGSVSAAVTAWIQPHLAARVLKKLLCGTADAHSDFQVAGDCLGSTYE